MGKKLCRRGPLVLASIVIALACAPAAPAAPASVGVRVEGPAATIFDGRVSTDAAELRAPADGNTPRACAGPSALTALDAAARAGGFAWDGTFSSDFLVTRIAGLGDATGATGPYWGFWTNLKASQVGGCAAPVTTGDEVLWAFDAFGGPPDFSTKAALKLSGPATARVGAPVTVQVANGESGAPVAGASVGGASTGADGKATVTFAAAGDQILKAEAPGAIRSRALRVCVSTGTDGRCGAAPAVVTGPRILSIGIEDGARFVARRGPRELSGRIQPGSSNALDVKIRLYRRYRGACDYYSAKRERLRRTACGRAFYQSVAERPQWSYLLPDRLPAGRWLLDVRVLDGNLKADGPLGLTSGGAIERGRTRVRFTVASSPRGGR